MNEHNADVIEVRRTADLFLKPGYIVEVRAFESTTGAFRRPSKLSGYFDNANKLVEAVAGIMRTRGIYITRNPVQPELLERAANQLDFAKAGRCTGTDGVAQFRWLTIDLDPERPRDVCATEAERQAAIVKATSVKEHLHLKGWPDPVEGDSGNGRYLMYLVDLPVKDSEVVKRCLKALAERFDGDGVEIDQQMAKPSQLVRLFGTMNRKGANTTERPHRMSRLISIPQSLQIVPNALLDKLAPEQTKRAKAISSRSHQEQTDGGLAIDEWITKHELPVEGPEDWTSEDGQKCKRWVFPVCPWNPEHKNKSAFIIQFPSGAIGAGCHHNGCSSKDWHALRDVVDQDWRERRCASNYEATRGGFVYRKHTHEAVSRIPISNFTARIVAEKVQDDGVEVNRSLSIEAGIGGKTITTEVPVADFALMNWVTKNLGSRAVIYPGNLNRDHVRTAIQLLSEKQTERVQYQHTGWREMKGVWVYLHGGGTIGPVGTVFSTEIALAKQLAPMILRLPTDEPDLKAAIRSSLELVAVAPDSLTLPVYLAIWRAVLGDVNFSVHLAGHSGVGKTALAALGQQHFGAGFTALNLPSSWGSTANAIEGLMFMAKNMLFVTDDFAPSASQDLQRMNRDIERVIRAVGNHAGRQRARTDGSVRPEKPPRCLLLSTGEDVPRAQSVRARMLVLEMEPKDMKWDQLTHAQENAAAGRYATAMGGYIQWLAARYDDVTKKMKEDVVDLRAKLTGEGQHRRTPEMAASLLAGFRPFLEFCVQSAALSESESTKLFERAERAIAESAAIQTSHQDAVDPVSRFLELLSSALTTGRAHVANMNGKAPSNPTAWGWREREGGGSCDHAIHPQGELIGWLDGGDLYLDRNAAYRAAQMIAGPGGDALGISLQTIIKRMSERKLLRTSDTKRTRQTVRRTIQGVRRDVLHLSAGAIFETEVAQSSQCPNLPEGTSTSQKGPHSYGQRSRATDDEAENETLDGP